MPNNITIPAGEQMEEEKTPLKIICMECGNTFELSPSEQEFFISKNFNFPKRCKPCRVIRRRNNVDAYKKTHKKDVR